MVYEDPWLAGGHNGLSNAEDPRKPQDPYPRVKALRETMREQGIADTVPIVMAGGVLFTPIGQSQLNAIYPNFTIYYYWGSKGRPVMMR